MIKLVASVAAVILAVAGLSPAFAAEKAKKKAKKKGYDYENSKYKAYNELVPEATSYRFDERGNPIPPGGVKKKAGKKKKKAAEEEAEKPAEGGDAPPADAAGGDLPPEGGGGNQPAD